MKFKDSRAPTAEKAQQDPHYYWFLTGLTAPVVVQSMEAGAAETSSSSTFLTVFGTALYPKSWALNSARVKSAY
jgi:hypothetical protein